MGQNTQNNLMQHECGAAKDKHAWDHRKEYKQVHENQKPRNVQRACKAAEGVGEPARVVVPGRLEEKPHEPKRKYRRKNVGDEHLEAEPAEHPAVRLRRRKRIRKPLLRRVYLGHHEVDDARYRHRIERGPNEPVGEMPC